jgi:hypothetical protein
VAATLTETADLARWPKFVREVQAAMVTAAVAVGAELADDPPTEAQRLRHALSANVLRDPETWTPTFAWAVAANPTITHESSNGDIQWSVNAVWNAMAGVVPTP